MVMIVDKNWLSSHLDDPSLVIIDARGLMPYRFGHIRNAVPLNIESVISIADNGSNLVIDAKTAERVFGNIGIDDYKTVVVYGEYPDPSAARIVWTLMYYGHTNVSLLDIGYSRWAEAGLPTTREVPEILKTKNLDPTSLGNSFVPKMDPKIRADAEMIKQKQNNPNVVVLDARTPQEHFQARIPGSILHNWEEGLGEPGNMIKDKDNLMNDFERIGITMDKEIICYCHSGIRASHKFLQLKQAGFNNVRMYDGSIIDWAQRKYPLR
jgi:thiosulfate/3-mercaptopyruvate sulfurtransferase